jgi:hypothetical protein
MQRHVGEQRVCIIIQCVVLFYSAHCFWRRSYYCLPIYYPPSHLKTPTALRGASHNDGTTATPCSVPDAVVTGPVLCIHHSAGRDEVLESPLRLRAVEPIPRHLGRGLCPASDVLRQCVGVARELGLLQCKWRGLRGWRGVRQARGCRILSAATRSDQPRC